MKKIVMLALSLMVTAQLAEAQSKWRTPEFDDSFRVLHAAAWDKFEVAIGTQRFVFDTTVVTKAPTGMTVATVQISAKASLTPVEWEAFVKAQLDTKLADLVKKTAGKSKMGVAPGSLSYDGPDTLGTWSTQRGIALVTQQSLTRTSRIFRMQVMIG